MVIEIRKAGFTNKGAELMLRATVQQIRNRIPDAEIVMIPDNAESYCRRGELCLKQKVWYQRYGIRWGSSATLIPRRIRQRYGLYVDSEVDVVLDAAGFAYGDQWPVSSLREASSSATRWKKRGTKLVLLPQAFGPFSDSHRRRLLKRLVANADLIFPRETESYSHITDVVGEQPHVRTAPDFTNLIEGVVPASFDCDANRFAVIPNYRMIDKTDRGTSQGYIELMVSIVDYLQTKKTKPFLLIHEGVNDVWLAEQINTKLTVPINVVTESDALSIKGIIGNCDGAVSSRFHGIVSALSQGVPTLGTTWSHKYEMLFQDYGFPEGVITANQTVDEVRSKIDRITDTDQRSTLQASLGQYADQHKRAAEEMWDEVFSVIDQR